MQKLYRAPFKSDIGKLKKLKQGPKVLWAYWSLLDLRGPELWFMGLLVSIGPQLVDIPYTTYYKARPILENDYDKLPSKFKKYRNEQNCIIMNFPNIASCIYDGFPKSEP